MTTPVAPDILGLVADATVVDTRPGAVLVDRSPFFPGGGGQMADRGTLAWAGGEVAVMGVGREPTGDWLLIAGDTVPSGAVRLAVDPAFRALMSELHTLAHVLNALVYRRFGGALLTGAQLNADATLRVDFDLPGADADAPRALEGPLNDVIRQDLAVRIQTMAWDDAAAEPGTFRSKAVTPPRGADGTVKIVEIVGLDRQACGGTHLASTGAARPVRILKIDNKGRQNRRVRVGFVDPG